MREGTTHILQIMGIHITDITEKELEEDLKLHAEYHSKEIQYVIDQNGYIRYAEDYLEKEIEPDKKITKIDVLYMDTFLEEEVSNAGMINLLPKYDWRPIIEKLEHVDRKKRTWSNTQRVVCDVIYHTSYDYYSGGYDCEEEVKVVGYMTDKLEIVYTDSNYPAQLEEKEYHW